MNGRSKSSWEQNYRLGGACTIKHGFAFKGEFMTTEENEALPIVVNIVNFQYTGGFRFESTKVQRYSGSFPSEYELRPGDVLVVMTCQTPKGEILGVPGRIPQGTNRFLHNQRMGLAVLKNSDVLDLGYLYYLFLSSDFNQHLFATSTGAKILHTAPSRIEDYRFARPPIDVQRSIAYILSAYDDLIENNTRRIKILEDMAQMLYREWFVNFRFPGHEKVRMVESELGPIPEGWTATSLGATCLNFDSRRKPLSSMERATRPGPYPYYGAAKIFDFIDNYLFDGRYLLFAEDGTVITAERRPVLQLTNGKFWPNNHTHVLKGRPPVSTYFLYLAMLQVDISGYITGAAQPKITQANLNRIPVLVSSPELLETFDSICSPFLDEVAVLTEKQKNLRTTRDFLLPKLISGDIPVEVAAELMEQTA